MPGGDRTGPQGMGPMTGRGAGICVGNNVPGDMNPAGGRGMAFRRGRLFGGGGRGRGFAFNSAPAVPIAPQPLFGYVPYDESMGLDALRGQIQVLETSLSGIQKRIEELETQSVKKEPESKK